MHLLIRAVSLAGQPLTQAISAYFDERGGTIGRSDTNTLALPDPERRISRLQAEVSRSPDGWRVLNVGNANPIWHNNRPVPPGDGVLLDEGDELQIGTYALRVNYSQNDETARTITKGRATIDSRTVIAGSGLEPKTDSGRMTPNAPVASAAAPLAAPVAPVASTAVPPALVPAPAAAASPFADLLGDLSTGSASLTPPGAGPAPSSASPFADILGFGASSPSLSSIPVSAPSASPAHAVSRLPDDFDPFADLAPALPSGRSAAPLGGWDLPKSAPAPTSASPFDIPSGASALPGDLDLLGSVQPAGSQSIDQMFGLGGGGGRAASSHDPLADFLKRTEPEAPHEAAVGAPSSVDPLALLTPRGQAASATPAAATTLPDNVPELNAAMVLPRAGLPVSAATLEPDTLPVSFSFMAPKPSGAMGLRTPTPASPFADLETPPSFSEEEDDTRPGELDFGLGGAEPASFESASFEATPVEAFRFQDVPAPAPSPAVAASGDVLLQSEPASASPAASASATAGASADTAALWAAFCEGAGVKFVPPQGLNPDLMRVMGQLLRNAVDGSLKLVAARAATKVELRAEVTVIQAKRNNPLKFSPDTQSAMEQLLQPPMRGFMSGPESVADAMDDLLGHTIGTMVGMRAALEGVLSRFEPSQLENKLVGHSMLDSLLPMNRRAKLWELYLQHYETVRTEAQDDFHNLFGRAFLQAYEEQLDRLYAERREAGRAPGSTA